MILSPILTLNVFTGHLYIDKDESDDDTYNISDGDFQRSSGISPPAQMPPMPEFKVTSDGGSESIGAQGIDPSQVFTHVDFLD